jgi:chromosomal replication initiator protein
MIDTPDYETKVKIIRAKSESIGMHLPEDIVTYLADNISANIREIEGALLSLNANVSYMNRKVSTSLAKEVLKAYVHMSQKEISINRITEIVCKYFNIDEQSFNSSKRTREVAQARQIAMYLAKQHTKLPLAAIGSAIGGRNHATVLHSCKNVTNLIETDKVIKNQIDEIEKMIQAG